MQLQDRITFDAPKRTKDGFMAVRAKAARSGIYEYAPGEVGAPAGFKDSVVKVYRPESEVFAKDSVHSFLQKPITNDHPAVAVTADNWKQYAGGSIANAMRDGEFLAFDLVLMDKAMIDAVDSGKRELSNGYSCELVWGDGVTSDGVAYHATQTNIRGNHVALVDKGRAGSQCAIADGVKKFAICDAIPNITGEIKMKITLDGVQVTLTDASEVQAAFDKIKADAANAATAAETALADAKAQVGTLTAEKATLEKQLADALAVDHDKMVADRAELIGKAKALKADIVTDGKSADDIRKEIVTASLGDVAKDFDAGQIAAAFAVMAKDAKAPDSKVVPIGDVKPKGIDLSAVQSARAAWLADKNNAHRANRA